MRGITQRDFGGPEVLELVETEEPRPGRSGVLIRVGGAGVNPADAAVRGGHWRILGEPPFTVGWDVAGTVEQVGENVTTLSPGDRVFGMPRFPQPAAAYAELVVAPVDQIARTPDTLTDVEAAALPLAGLTAYLALVQVAAVEAGQRVLIQAAGGGVGHLAVQIAKARGAHVTAVVSPAKMQFVRSLGADEVVDYTAGRVLEGLSPVDIAVDPFGGPNTQLVIAAMKPGGTIVALLDVNDDARKAADARDVRVERILVSPSGEQLAQIAALVDAGSLRPHVGATFPLELAAEAHRALAARPMGKIVLVP
jgi:NADPH:quinone reductase-like Zn-dependent oxidoreductase